MHNSGKLINDYFSVKEKLLFIEINEDLNTTGDNIYNQSKKDQKKKIKKMHILIPKRTSLIKRLKSPDDKFYDFVRSLLEIDPTMRLSAAEALKHPWMSHKY